MTTEATTWPPRIDDRAIGIVRSRANMPEVTSLLTRKAV